MGREDFSDYFLSFFFVCENRVILKTCRGVSIEGGGFRNHLRKTNGLLEGFLEAFFLSKNLLRTEENLLRSKGFLTTSGSPL